MEKNKQLVQQNSFTEFLLYTTSNGNVKVEIYLKNETVWLTQQKIAELFGAERSVVTKHLQNIYQDGELDKKSTCAKIAQVQTEWQRQVTRNLEFYNLDAIISVGYRVNSRQATHFRIWATQTLKEYIIKGFTMDDERLKNPNNIFGKDYFEEQLARIRDIRSSERRFYQKITDIYAQCSTDYGPNEKITKQFFATVQNKLHSSHNGFRIKSKIKLGEYNCPPEWRSRAGNQDLVTRKSENQIGFSIHLGNKRSNCGGNYTQESRKHKVEYGFYYLEKFAQRHYPKN